MVQAAWHQYPLQKMLSLRQAPPMPSIALLRDMTSLDVMCGHFWDAATNALNPVPARSSRLSEDAADRAVKSMGIEQ